MLARARCGMSRAPVLSVPNGGLEHAMHNMQRQPDRVAIDGPSASGKSTVGRMLAQRWGYRFLDTGIMYRCVTHIALRRKVDLASERDLGELAAELEFQLRQSAAGESELTVCGQPVGRSIYSDEVTASVSPVSAVASVRAALVAKQRQIGAEGEIVMAGRDIGTVVMPDAPLKVYLDASPGARAHRRFAELRCGGGTESYEEILASIAHRDGYDSSREHSPLARADDAILINTDALSAEEVVNHIIETCATQLAAERTRT